MIDFLVFLAVFIANTGDALAFHLGDTVKYLNNNPETVGKVDTIALNALTGIYTITIVLPTGKYFSAPEHDFVLVSPEYGLSQCPESLNTTLLEKGTILEWTQQLDAIALTPQNHPVQENNSTELNAAEMKRLVLSAAQPLAEDLYTYRWGEAPHEYARIEHPEFDIETVNKGRGTFCGKGLYVSRTPLTEGGKYGKGLKEIGLIRITIPKGTLVVDYKILQDSGLSHLFWKVADLKIPVLFKCERDDWVLKSNIGIKVERFNGAEFSDEDLKQFLNSIQHPEVRDYFHAQVGHRLR